MKYWELYDKKEEYLKRITKNKIDNDKDARRSRQNIRSRSKSRSRSDQDLDKEIIIITQERKEEI